MPRAWEVEAGGTWQRHGREPLLLSPGPAVDGVHVLRDGSASTGGAGAAIGQSPRARTTDWDGSEPLAAPTANGPKTRRREIDGALGESGCEERGRKRCPNHRRDAIEPAGVRHPPGVDEPAADAVQHGCLADRRDRDRERERPTTARRGDPRGRSVAGRERRSSAGRRLASGAWGASTGSWTRSTRAAALSQESVSRSGRVSDAGTHHRPDSTAAASSSARWRTAPRGSWEEPSRDVCFRTTRQHDAQAGLRTAGVEWVARESSVPPPKRPEGPPPKSQDLGERRTSPKRGWTPRDNLGESEGARLARQSPRQASA